MVASRCRCVARHIHSSCRPDRGGFQVWDGDWPATSRGLAITSHVLIDRRPGWLPDIADDIDPGPSLDQIAIHGFEQVADIRQDHRRFRCGRRKLMLQHKESPFATIRMNAAFMSALEPEVVSVKRRTIPKSGSWCLVLDPESGPIARDVSAQVFDSEGLRTPCMW